MYSVEGAVLASMGLAPLLERLGETLEGYAAEAQYFRSSDLDPRGPLGPSEDPDEHRLSLHLGVAGCNWRLLGALYSKMQQERENLKDERPIPTTLEFIKQYIWAGRLDHNLFKFEDENMNDFVKEIFVVSTGKIMPYYNRIQYATQMLKQKPARTQHVLDYMGMKVRRLRTVQEVFQRDLEAWGLHNLAGEEESARKYQKTADAASSAPSGAAP